MNPITLAIGALTVICVGLFIKEPSFCASGIVLMWMAVAVYCI